MVVMTMQIRQIQKNKRSQTVATYTHCLASAPEWAGLRPTMACLRVLDAFLLVELQPVRWRLPADPVPGLVDPEVGWVSSEASRLLCLDLRERLPSLLTSRTGRVHVHMHNNGARKSRRSLFTHLGTGFSCDEYKFNTNTVVTMAIVVIAIVQDK